MRKKRNGENTKAIVLEYSENIFTEGGFAGTSVAAVPKASGISDGPIFYHFKSKKKLYEAAMQNR